LKFNKFVVQKIGFDFDAGRLDTTTHPFATGLHPEDVRITTRYKEDDVLYSLGSAIHEAGHGLYEQGLPSEHFGTPLAEAVSLGIHESQSRMWENLIGKSEPFWKYFYPKLQKEFPEPFRKVSLKDFYRAINNVTPSLIRTEADEVTYNLHIILRFEIEKEMIEGSIDLKDLPNIWRAKMKEYFGISVPNDTLGVLQDVHWSTGLIGYFPTYSFGNLYSAQFFAAMKRDIPDAGKKIAAGKFEEIREWLRHHIHSRGKLYKAGALVKKVTGEPLRSAYFIDYLKQKYGRMYL
jgi:carboxypeptidase Taq